MQNKGDARRDYRSIRVAQLIVLLVPALNAVPSWGAGGDDCATATVIGSLPYLDPGNTCAPFLDTYGELCGAEGNSRDVVYMYTPATAGCVNISLCNSTSGVNFKLYVYSSDAGGCPSPQSGDTNSEIACNDTTCPPYARISGLPVNAGVTYWIVVDGSTLSCGDYQLDVTPCPQACCLADGTCADLPAGACTGQGGAPQGPGTACATANCPQPPQACCLAGGACMDLDAASCSAQGGTAQGPGTTCGGTSCPQASEACCLGSTCQDLPGPDCFDQGGWPQGVGSVCAEAACFLGACCIGPLQCMDNLGEGLTESSCIDRGGAYVGGVRCNGLDCRLLPCADDADCEDQNPCTQDSCDVQTSTCVYSPVPDCCLSNVDCLDGLFCNGAEYCIAHACQPGTPKDCDDNDPCTADTCDEVIDQCVHSLVPGCCADDADCEDGNACTIDVCNAGACEQSFATAGTPCGDGGAGLCSAPDTCDEQGHCDSNHLPAGSPCGDSSDTICTDPDTCESNGLCLPNHAQDGIPCDDGDLCTSADVCAGGICSGADNGNCSACTQGGAANDPTHQLSFQAFIADADGRPIDLPSVDLTFQFYSLGGTPVGSPILLPGVPVTRSVVSIGIPVTQTIFDGSARELGVSINGGSELAPRIAVRSSAHSFITQCANSDAVVDHLAIGATQRGGGLEVLDPSGNAALSVTTTSNGGAALRIGPPLGPRASGEALGWSHDYDSLDLDEFGDSFYLENTAGTKTIILDPTTQPLPTPIGEFQDLSGSIHVRNDQGNSTVILHGGSSGEIMLGPEQSPTVRIHAAGDGELYIGTRRSDGTYPIGIEADFGGSGSRVTTDTLKIRGGSDLSELFDVQGGPQPDPGSVLCIDSDSLGKLVVSTAPYDRRVAGVVSGAGPVRTGLLMGQDGTAASGGVPVALTGRVYVRVDAEFGSVAPGDLLTTSPTTGHAMKVVDFAKAQGAILGKAMTGLERGRGLVLVLVTLQ